MNVLLINPPLCNITGRKHANSPPLGLLYLAASLEKSGHAVKVLDAEALRLSWDALGERIREEAPDVVGATSVSLSYEAMLETVKVSRKHFPRAKNIVGGFGPSIEPERVLRETPVEAVVVGEGERTAPELLDALAGERKLDDVAGIAFLRDGELVRTGPRDVIMDLDSLPFPAYHLLEPDYLHYGGVHLEWEGIKRPNAVLLASRGCPHRCIFCSLKQRKVRRRSASSICDEIELVAERYGVNSVQLYDDEFIGMNASQNEWIVEICDEIKRRGLDRLGYMVQGRCSRFVELDVLKKMREANFRWIWWGVESGSQKVLDIIRKDLKPEDVRRSFALAKQADIRSLMFLMVGFPGETEEDVMQTAALAAEVRPEVVRVHITTPMPGSDLWDMLESRHQIDTKDFSLYDSRINVVHHTDELSSAEIKRLYEMLKFRFEEGHGYFAKLLLKDLFTLRGWKKLPRRLGKAFRYGTRWMRSGRRA